MRIRSGKSLTMCLLAVSAGEYVRRHSRDKEDIIAQKLGPLVLRVSDTHCRSQMAIYHAPDTLLMGLITEIAQRLLRLRDQVEPG
jgi:hypothetical protein